MNRGDKAIICGDDHTLTSIGLGAHKGKTATIISLVTPEEASQYPTYSGGYKASIEGLGTSPYWFQAGMLQPIGGAATHTTPNMIVQVRIVKKTTSINEGGVIQTTEEIAVPVQEVIANDLNSGVAIAAAKNAKDILGMRPSEVKIIVGQVQGS